VTVAVVVVVAGCAVEATSCAEATNATTANIIEIKALFIPIYIYI
jgi:hypothetical protein